MTTAIENTSWKVLVYGIYALVVFVSEILLVRCAHSFDFWYVNNSCVNTVRQHFPWSILYSRRHSSSLSMLLRVLARMSQCWSETSYQMVEVLSGEGLTSFYKDNSVNFFGDSKVQWGFLVLESKVILLRITVFFSLDPTRRERIHVQRPATRRLFRIWKQELFHCAQIWRHIKEDHGEQEWNKHSEKHQVHAYTTARVKKTKTSVGLRLQTNGD